MCCLVWGGSGLPAKKHLLLLLGKAAKCQEPLEGKRTVISSAMMELADDFRGDWYSKGVAALAAFLPSVPPLP